MNITNPMEDFTKYFFGMNDPLESTNFDQYGLQGKLKHYKKGQHLISQGKSATKIFFLLKGFVRYLSVSYEGKEFTQSFALAPSFAGSTRAMTKQVDSLFSIEVLDDVICLEFEWHTFFDKMKSKAGFLEEYSRLLEILFVKKEERVHAFVQHSAEQRYLTFLDNHPELSEKIPLKMIASYIGITPIALSRIRKKLK